MRPRAFPAAPRQRLRGLTLVELIMFIVIVGAVAAAMVQAFSGTARGSHLGKEITQATQLAQQRMEVILGQRWRLDYGAFDNTNYDPCQLALGFFPGSQACATTSYPGGSFIVQSSFNNPVPACDPDCKEISVTVNGPFGDQRAQLRVQVWDY